MNNKDNPQFEVLIASPKIAQIKRIERILKLVFDGRKEKINIHQAETIEGAVSTIARLEKSMIPLVVMAGFYGEWFMISGRIREKGIQTIAAFLMGDNEREMAIAYSEGLRSVSLQQAEEEAAEEIKNLLFDPTFGYLYGLYGLVDASTQQDDTQDSAPVYENISQLENPNSGEESQDPGREPWDY